MLEHLRERAPHIVTRQCALLHNAAHARRQNRQTHYLDEADVFLLDMVKLFVRMEDSKRMLIACNVATQRQVELVASIFYARNRRNGVVAYLTGMRYDAHLRVII